MFIKIKFKEDFFSMRKSTYFINEHDKKLVLVDSIRDAFNYMSTLEFKVSYKQWGLSNKTDIISFEKINDKTLLSEKFDINEIEINTEQPLRFNDIDFAKLMECGITSSHWLYDKNNKWIAFPKEEDYAKICKIRYYRRGLTNVITSYDNWKDRYNEHSWHPSFEGHHTLMLNQTIQQISLLEQDSCHEFTIIKT